MPITYYRSDDASAPTLTGEVNSLINLLDKCLVTGYGSKGAAGWTKPYTGTNKAAFRMASGAGQNGHYIRVLDDGTDTDGAARTASLLGYVAMTTVDAGTEQFPSAPQLTAGFAGLRFTKSNSLDTVQRPWLVVADETAFFLYCWNNATAPFTGLNPSSRQSTFTFGQFESFKTGEIYNTVINGRNNVTYNDTGSYTEALRATSSASFAANTRQFVARSFLGVSGSVATSIVNGGTNSSGSTNLAPVNLGPGAFTADYSYTPQQIREKDHGNVYALIRGNLPFCFGPEESMPDPTGTNGILRSFDVLDGQGVDAGKTFIVIPQYTSGTPYAMFVQNSGSR